MPTNLVKQDERILTATTVTLEQLDLINRTIAVGATPDELKLYLYDCTRQGVHPLDKLLHFTKRGGKYTPVTSIDLMRTRAADSGEYAGNDDAVFTTEEDELASARVTVWRFVQGQRCPFVATARWSEYYPGEVLGAMWRKMPHTMLAKCAEALALRKGFPRQLAGLYAQEELDQADRGGRVEAAAPSTVIDATTGAEAPTTDRRPTPPAGYTYIDRCWEQRGWWHVVVARDEFKTKKSQLGEIAEQAFQGGVPVKLETNAPWLNGIMTWKPSASILPPSASGDDRQLPL